MLQHRKLGLDHAGQRQQQFVQRTARLEAVRRGGKIGERRGGPSSIELEHAHVRIDARNAERIAGAFERDARGAEIGQRIVVAMLGHARVAAPDERETAIERICIGRQQRDRGFEIACAVRERAAAHARRAARGQNLRAKARIGGGIGVAEDFVERTLRAVQPARADIHLREPVVQLRRRLRQLR